MTDPGPDPKTDLDAYLRRYRDKFTRDAMAAKLIEAGHPADQVEAAMARAAASDEAALTYALAAVDADDERSVRARRVTRAIVLIVYAGICLWVLTSVGAGSVASPGFVPFVVLMVLLGLLLSWLIGRTRSTSVMVVWGVAAVTLGLPLAFLGACLMGLGSGTYL